MGFFLTVSTDPSRLGSGPSTATEGPPPPRFMPLPTTPLTPLMPLPPPLTKAAFSIMTLDQRKKGVSKRNESWWF